MGSVCASSNLENEVSSWSSMYLQICVSGIKLCIRSSDQLSVSTRAKEGPLAGAHEKACAAS